MEKAATEEDIIGAVNGTWWSGRPPMAPNGDPAQDDGDLIPVIVLVPDDGF